MRIVVVGAGVLGAALAQTLARRGIEVTLIEQRLAGRPGAASLACSRILRLAHGAEVEETRSAWLSHRLWRELERRTERSLFCEIGMAWIAVEGDAWHEESRAVLLREGLDAELLSPAEAGRLLPGLRVDDIEHVLFEPQAGLLRASDAVEALVSDAVAAGAEFRHGRATPLPEAVAIDGHPIEADAVVWACGAWTPRLFPELVRGAVIQQDVCYFAVGEGWRSPPAPAFGEPRLSASGSGDFDGFGFKVGLDTPGPAIDPDAASRDPLPMSEPGARAYLRRRFPDLSSAVLLRTETCQTVALEPSLPAADAALAGGVRLLRHPEQPCVWLLGDGSGHAFKHAPAIAARTATMVAPPSEETP